MSGNPPAPSNQGTRPLLASQQQEAVAEGEQASRPIPDIQAAASYRSTGFLVSPEVPQGSSQSAGFVSPPKFPPPPPPRNTGMNSPSLPQQPPVAPDDAPESSFGSVDFESSNLGSSGASSGSAYVVSNHAPASEGTSEGYAYPAHTDGLTDAGFETYESSEPGASESPLISAFRGPWEELPPVGAYASPGFPDGAELNTESAEVTYVSEPLPLPIYIMQSRNGYQRSRAVFSNTRYYPELLQQPVFGSGTPSKRSSPPVTGTKGGWAY